MAAAQVIGNDLTVTLAGQSGVFELNVMMPVMAYNVLESIRLLAASAVNLTDRCIVGIRANVKRCNEMIEKSLALSTALVPEIGYDAAAAISKESYATDKTIREIVLERNLLPPKRVKLGRRSCVHSCSHIPRTRKCGIWRMNISLDPTS